MKMRILGLEFDRITVDYLEWNAKLSHKEIVDIEKAKRNLEVKQIEEEDVDASSVDSNDAQKEKVEENEDSDNEEDDKLIYERKTQEEVAKQIEKKMDFDLRWETRDTQTYNEIGAYSINWPFVVYADHT